MSTPPGSAALLGITAQDTVDGVATIFTSQPPPPAICSGPLTAGPPDHLVFSLQPPDTVAGTNILLAVTVQDSFNNTVIAPPANITLDSAVNPGGWPLQVRALQAPP